MLGSGALRFLQRCKAPQVVVAGTTATFAAGISQNSTTFDWKSREGQWRCSPHDKLDAILSSAFFLLHSSTSIPTTHCEAAVKEGIDPGDYSNHLSEEEANFLNTLAVYRRWLKDIKKQWAISSPPSDKFPNNIPSEKEISALEMDLQMYQKGDQGNTRLCQDLEFRIASYYIFREKSTEQQYKGFQIIKRLTVAGHWDAICLYAMIWNTGGVAGIEAKPHLAVKFWRQAADMGHLPSMYELAAALYMGDGVPEDPSQSVKYFIKAADLGHSGAAYLLADCYLDGVGVERNRAKALEWLMTAAEMGHRAAQQRAEALLTSSMPDGITEDINTTVDDDHMDEEEYIRWGEHRPGDWRRRVSLERRFTIGGGSRNPKILLRRQTAVDESRQSGGGGGGGSGQLA